MTVPTKEMFIVISPEKKPTIPCNYKVTRDHAACYLSAGKHDVSQKFFFKQKRN